MKLRNIFILFLSFLLIGCGQTEEKISKKYFNTTNVKSGSILTSKYYVGYTTSFENTALSPKTGGRITKIYKDVGDEVKKGDLLATLDGTEARVGYSSVEEIITSLEDLKEATSETYDSQIKSTREQINQLQTSKEVADINISGAGSGLDNTISATNSQIEALEAQIAQAQIALDAAELEYENTKNDLEKQRQDIYSNSKNSINMAMILGNNVYDLLDRIYGITNRYKDEVDRTKMYVGAKDSMKKSELTSKLTAGYRDFKELEEENKSFENEEDIKNKLEKTYNYFNNDLKDILELSYEVLDNSIPSVGSLSEQQIQQRKSYITDFQQKNQEVILSISGNYKTGLKGSIDNISDFENSQKSGLDLLEKKVENAKEQIKVLEKNIKAVEASSSGQITEMDVTLQKAEKSKEAIESQIAQAEAGIEALNNQKQASLYEIEAKIAEAKAELNNASVIIQNGNVYSNMNGVVVKKAAEEGVVIGAGTPIFYVSNDKNIKIQIDVSEDTAEKIEIGQKVQVEIEGINKDLTASVKNIYPSKNAITKRTGVELKLEENSEKIKFGSLVKVYFEENVGDEIIIPNNAIVTKYLLPGVYVLENGIATFKKIEILSQDSQNASVIGLNIGDTIITDGKDNIYDGEVLESGE